MEKPWAFPCYRTRSHVPGDTLFNAKLVLCEKTIVLLWGVEEGERKTERERGGGRAAAGGACRGDRTLRSTSYEGRLATWPYRLTRELQKLKPTL